MSNEEAAPDTKGVTAELLTTVDLGPEIEGMAGRQLRMRMFTFEPGAVLSRPSVLQPRFRQRVRATPKPRGATNSWIEVPLSTSERNRD
jgi:hypothetical protein